MKLQIVKGMRDLIDQDARVFRHLEEQARQIFALYGFEEIRTPILEMAELFTHGIGEDTDIVGKEMYLLEDRRGQQLAMRPEGTAAVVRHVVQNQVLNHKKQAKYYYFGPMFRYERPQKGRFRQFHQIGVECFGVEGPVADLEMFLMLQQYFAAINLKDVGFQINSIGCMDESCRPLYKQNLVTYLKSKQDDLCPDCNRRLDTNPLRVLDCKNETCKEITDGAPHSADCLCSECHEHFEELKQLLDEHQVAYECSHRLVRGLDYYSKTVFEVYSANLGAQSAAGGGGRFDNLFEQYGQKKVPSIGFALGLDRLALLCPPVEATPPGVFVLGFETAPVSKLVAQVRELGIGCSYDPAGSSMKSQFRQADKAGVRFVAILGEDEIKSGVVTLKDFQTGEQEKLSPQAAVERIKEALS